jgi:hypothetical protein
MDEYRANTYNLLLRNCNHFSDEFVRRLYAGKKRVPGFINRAANVGSLFHCFVPTKFVTVTPPGQEDEAARLSQLWKIEEDAKKQKQKWQGKGASLDELSTRETEMSMDRAGSTKSLNDDPKSNIIMNFFN